MGKKSSVKKLVSKEKLPVVVYGLDGIMRLFDVSKGTAWRYRHGCIKDACMQNGNKIIVDTRKALQLFANAKNNVDDIVESPEAVEAKDITR